ncbi:MAG: hypothetical protein ACXVAX_09570 [Pseudobdellovibrio sp.]
MRIGLISLLLLSVFRVFAFPEIKSWQNSPIIVFDNKKQAVLVKKGLLKRPFALVTANHDQLELGLNHFDTIFLYEKSKAQVLDFASEGELINEFYLLDGKLRYKVEFKGLDKERNSDLTLKTSFFDLKISKPVDFLIELDMAQARVDVKVIKGSLPLEFFAYEKKINLTEGQQVRFQGVLSDDKQSIKYDYLLDGKKVPKGTLGEVKTFDLSGFAKEEADAKAKETARKNKIEFARLEKIRKQKAYEDSFLCKKPFANKDQCAWWVENGKCYRKRCNVSGGWGDQIERPLSAKCKADFTVDACDY